ncbi:MAG: hypothetical protein ACOYKE_06380, partial [Ferruginibacter sp.]
SYTAIICGTLLLLAIFIQWPLTKPTPPLVEDLIEVNLGNEMEGDGEIQPLRKGEMSQVPETPQNGDAGSTVSTASTNETIEPDEKEDKDAAPVNKPEIVKSPKPNITPVKQPVKNNTPTPVANPTPKPQKPKYAYKGPGTGNGNNATTDNGYQNQGNKPGQNGDKGVPTGKPDSYGNTPGGKSGVTVERGARPLNLGQLKFEDDFNENAKVTVDVKYNSAGSFVSCSIAKSTTTDATILRLARKKAAELKFPATNGEGGVTTILFNFKVQN